MSDELELASDFEPHEGEANFGPTIVKEVVKGTHIAPECVLVRDRSFVLVDWPNGLPRHDTGRTLRFPHGLMRFGETLEEAAKRLVSQQTGFKIESIVVEYVYSYVDDKQHWHIEPLVVCVVSGTPTFPSGATGVVEFAGDVMPDGAVWDSNSFKDAYQRFLKKYLD